MNKTNYPFQVYSPIKGMVYMLFLISICILFIGLIDQYGPVWLQQSAWKNPALFGIAGLLLYWFSKKAVNDVEITIDANGISLDWLPNWRWGAKENRRIGWLELDRWIYKQGRSDGHSIWWNRLSFKLSDGSRILLLPTDDFEKDDRLIFFLRQLEQAIEEYNSRPATQIPIYKGPENQKILLGAWFTLLLSLIFCLLTALTIYITIEKGKGLSWMMLGFILMFFAFVYQCWTRAKTIRNTLKS